MNIINKTFYFVGILIIFLAWFIGSIIIQNELALPKISSTFESLFNILKNKETYLIIFNTISRLILTVVFTYIIAFVLVLLSSISVKTEQLIKPLVALMKTLPIAAIIIVLLVSVGRNNSPYYITGLVILPLMYETTLIGIKSINKGITEEIKMDSNVNWLVVSKVYFPMTLPYILAGTIQSLGLGLKVMVMSEFITQPNLTIGAKMSEERVYQNLDNIFAWTIILVVFILLVEYFLKKIKLNKNTY
ncbi:MAG: ABC transporter permease subunit [Bacilli bacterium]|nr:ABC transporter permease subunit [Bacilli bacterium]